MQYQPLKGGGPSEFSNCRSGLRNLTFEMSAEFRVFGPDFARREKLPAAAALLTMHTLLAILCRDLGSSLVGWPFAGVRFRGRYWGHSEYRLLRRICPVLTQSGHAPIARKPAFA